MPQPSGIDLNNVRYLLREGNDSFAIIYESALVRRREVVGAERGSAEQSRLDLLTWRWDNWSRGEGQRWINTSLKETFNRYFKSGGAVDIRRWGVLKLGLAASQETLASAATTFSATVAPRMITAGKPWVFYDTSAQRKSGGAWATVATGLTANISGHLAALNSRVFVGSTNMIRRVTSAANSQWVASKGQNLVIGGKDMELFYAFTTTDEKVTIRSVPIQPSSSAPFTPVDENTIPGIDESVAMAADGNDIYALVSVDEEMPFLFKLRKKASGNDFKPFGRFPPAFFVQNNKREVMWVVNGIVFVGGYFTNPFTNVDDPALLWFTNSAAGVVGVIRERGTNEQIKAMFPTIDNEILMATTKGKVYSYSLSTGGFYEFASGMAATDDVTSMTYSKGVFYFAVWDGSTTGAVWATKTSGTGKYPSSVKVESSQWDYDLPDDKKVALSISVCGVFPTSTSCDVSLEFDDGSEITTDSAGATMTANTTGITTFTLSDNDTERTFLWAKVNLTLKTSDTSKTPTIYYSTLRSTTATRVKFIECKVDLSDHRLDGRRVPERAVTGALALQEIETLLDSTSNTVLVLKPYFEKAAPPSQRTTDTYNVIFDEAVITEDTPGSGQAQLRFRVVG